MGSEQPNILFIILTSAPGEMVGDHYRLRKSLAREGAARVPFLLSAPPRFGVGKGLVIDAPATHADIIPTLLDMLGLAIPRGVDGFSLYPLLRGGQEGAWRDALHIEHAPDHQRLTDGREKYIWWPADGREQFFDLTSDPHELHDLAAAAPADKRVAAWRGRLIDRLRDRPEGLVQKGSLVADRPYGAMIPAET